MPGERSSISQVVQIGVETTSGTSVAANKRLQSLSIMLSPKANVKTFVPSGTKYASVAALGREWVEGSLDGAPTYDELQYALAGMMAYAAPVQVMDGATPTTGYTWTFAPSSTAEDTIKTYTIEQGSAFRAHKATYGLFTGLSLKLTRDQLAASGGLMAQAVQDNITLTASPTLLPVVPILPTQFDIFADTTYAAVSGGTPTRLTRVTNIEWGLDSRYNGVWAIDSTKTSFAAHVESLPKTTFKITMEADAPGMAYLTNLRNGNTFYVRMLATGPNIYTGGVTVNYKATIDLAVKITNPGGFSDQDGLFAVDWEGELVQDASLGGPVKVVLINKQSAL